MLFAPDTAFDCVYLAIFTLVGLLQGDHLSGKPGEPGNVREMSGMLLTVREMSGKKSCHGKVSQNCSLLDEYLCSYGYLVASS